VISGGTVVGTDRGKPAPLRPTVLVVDDDQAIRNSLKFSLEIEGFAVRVYASGDELLKERELPDRGCLVIDYLLPGINGLELLGKLRARHCLLPAILATTHVDATLRQRIAAAGMVLVEKPFIGNALADAISAAVGRQSRDLAKD